VVADARVDEVIGRRVSTLNPDQIFERTGGCASIRQNVAPIVKVEACRHGHVVEYFTKVTRITPLFKGLDIVLFILTGRNCTVGVFGHRVKFYGNNSPPGWNPGRLLVQT
jgi:hypothetical protein